MGRIFEGEGYQRHGDPKDYNRAEDLFLQAWKRLPSNPLSLIYQHAQGEHYPNAEKYCEYQYYIDFAHYIDFAQKKKPTAIEIDGGYHNKESSKAADAKKEHYLRSGGWEVIRLQDYMVVKDADWCAEAVLNHLLAYWKHGVRLPIQQIAQDMRQPRYRAFEVFLLTWQNWQLPKLFYLERMGNWYQDGSRQYYIDFTHTESKIAIEIDDGYYDRQKEHYLRSSGWTVMCFHAQQVLENPGWCIQTVLAQIAPQPVGSPSRQQAPRQPSQRQKLGFWWALLFGMIAGGLEGALAQLSHSIGNSLPGGIFILVMILAIPLTATFLASKITTRKLTEKKIGIFTGTLAGILAAITFAVIASIVFNAHAPLVVDLLAIVALAPIGAPLGALGGWLGTLGRARR